MEYKPTLKEISLMTNVSISTVSRALSNPDKVKYATRKKIEKAIAEAQIQQSRSQSRLIGLIIPDIKNQFFPLMLTGIDSVASSNGKTIILCNSDGDSEKEVLIIKNLIDIGIDGIILISSDKSNKELEDLVKNDVIPIVFLDRDPGFESINLVTTENFEGMYQATRYLLTLGHKKILFLGGNKELSTSNERYNGYLSAIQELLPESNGNVVYGDFSFSTAYQEIRTLIDSNLFDYTAIASANDTMALGAIKALNESGLSVPKDVSIIGYDDIPSAEYAGLTTVRQPFIEMGRNAMYQLDIMQKETIHKPKRLLLPTSIIFRTSCAINHK